MNQLSATIVGKPLELSESDYWMKLIQIKPEEDLATMEDAAELIDAIYDLDPCDGTAETGGESVEEDDLGEPVEPVSEEVFWQNVAELLPSTVCSSDGNCFIAKLKVYRSHIDEPYKLVFDNGEQVEDTVQLTEKISEVLEVDGSSVDLRVSVHSSFSHKWVSVQPKNGGGAIALPDVEPNGSSLSFARPVVGMLEVSYESIYDLVLVKVPNTKSEVFGGRGEPGECEVVGYYAGGIYDTELEPPELDPAMEENDVATMCGAGIANRYNDDGDVTCYEIVFHEVRDACSGELADDKKTGESLSYYTEEEVSCPDTLPDGEEGRYLLGSRTVLEEYRLLSWDDVSDRSFFKDTCCFWLPKDEGLPRCEVLHGVYKGGRGIKGGVEAAKAKYGADVQLIAVSPPDGVCGESRVIQDVEQQNCCVGVSKLVWNYQESVETIGTNDFGRVAVMGGKRPVAWVVTGEGFFTNSARTKKEAITADGKLTIYTNDDACGACHILANDGCSETSGNMRSTAGYWKLVFDDYSKFYPKGDSPSAIIGGPERLDCDYVGYGETSAYIFEGYKDNRFKIRQSFQQKTAGIGEYQALETHYNCAANKEKWYEEYGSEFDVLKDFNSKNVPSDWAFYLDPNSRVESSSYPVWGDVIPVNGYGYQDPLFCYSSSEIAMSIPGCWGTSSVAETYGVAGRGLVKIWEWVCNEQS